jgi:hypothetical protein
MALDACRNLKSFVVNAIQGSRSAFCLRVISSEKRGSEKTSINRRLIYNETIFLVVSCVTCDTNNTIDSTG